MKLQVKFVNIAAILSLYRRKLYTLRTTYDIAYNLHALSKYFLIDSLNILSRCEDGPSGLFDLGFCLV